MNSQGNQTKKRADLLFKKIQADDEAALETLFRLYFPRLNDFAIKVIKDSSTSSDIIQELFIKLWEKRKEIQIQNIEAFLFKSVRNQCLDYIKHLKVVDNKLGEMESLARFEELYRIDFIRDEPYILIEQELKDEIENVINSLPDRCKEVFILSRIKGLKNKEIAVHLGINIKNVERHISRAMKAFNERFSSEIPQIIIILVIRSLMS